MELTLNPEYKGVYQGNLRQIELVMDPDKVAGLELYDRDQLDVLEWIHEVGMNRDLVSRSDFVSLPTAHFHYFTFDTTKPPFDDKRVRQAFAHAINRHELAEDRLLGLATPAVGGLIPPGIIGHSTELGLGFQPEKARELLDLAGYPYGQGFPEIEAISLGSRHHDIGIETQFLHDQWFANLGIEILWMDLEWDEFFLQLSNKPPLYHFGMMGLFPDPYDILVLGPREATWNQADARFLELIDIARKTEHFEEQIDRYREVDRYLIESAMIVPISSYQIHLLRKPWVKDLPYILDSPCWRDIIIEPH
jgi:ABC-type oligopeptide transport system substrate-binding subunit